MKEALLQNNNRPIIGKLSARYLKANFGRNLIAILAIALTTMMFTSLFTIGQGVLDVQQRETMRQVGGSSHGGFKNLTWEEFDTLKVHPDIKAYGGSIFVGVVENEALAKHATELRWTDENYAEWSFSKPTTGSLPQSEKELATATSVLDDLGVPHELGASVPVEFTVDGKKYKEEFTLSGFWEGDPAFSVNSVFLSRTYIDSILTISTESYFERADISPEKSLSLNVMLSNSINVESKLNKILSDCGYDPTRFDTGVNWAYTGSGDIDPAMILIIAVVMLLITGAGYLIIYNVFYISVTRDIRNYGLLKTLGTTPRQLHRLVRRQSWLLSLAGIPLGIIIGYAMGIFLMPAIISISSYVGADTSISFTLWIPLGAALFALITVWLSCRKPCKMAASVSPIEALRTHEVSGGRKKSRSSVHVSTIQMAWQNVTRNKKRVASVVLSLTLGTVLLNSVYSATKSFDIDKFMGQNILTDFSLAESKMLTLFELTYLDPQIIDDLSGLPGVTDASPVYMQEYQFPPKQKKLTEAVERFMSSTPDLPAWAQGVAKQTDEEGLPAHIYGVDRFTYDKLKFWGEKPTWEEFSTGEYILTSPLGKEEKFTQVFEPGETVNIKDRDGKDREYTALATVEVPYPSSPLHGHFSDISLVLPIDTYLESYMQENLMYLHLKADPESIPELEKTIADYCESRTVDYNSRSTYMAEFEGLQRTYLLVGGVLSGILGLVGILNFVNSIVTAILTRKTELAMLQSVGMTTKQLRKMLISEGMWYIALTAAVTLTLGNLLSVFITKVIAGQTWFFSFRFTMLPMAIVLPLLIIPAVVIPLVSYRSVSRQSVVERLREI